MTKVVLFGRRGNDKNRFIQRLISGTNWSGKVTKKERKLEGKRAQKKKKRKSRIGRNLKNKPLDIGGFTGKDKGDERRGIKHPL